MAKRHVTDAWAILIFVVMLAGYGVIIYLAIKNSNLKRILMPLNSQGEFCGEMDPKKDKLLIIDYTSLTFAESFFKLLVRHESVVSSKSICVEECPTVTGLPTVQHHFCAGAEAIITEDVLKTELENGNCLKFNFRTKPILHYCFLDLTLLLSSNITNWELEKYLNSGTVEELLTGSASVLSKLEITQEIISDLDAIKNYTPIYITICYVISAVMMLVLSFSLFFIFLSLYVVGNIFLIGMLAFVVVAYVGSTPTGQSNLEIQFIKKHVEKVLFSWMVESYEWTIAILSISLIFSLLFGIYILKVVRIACQYAVRAGKTTLFLLLNSICPLISIILQISVFGLWVYITICIITSEKNAYQAFKTDNSGGLMVTNVCDPTTTTPCIYGGISISNLNQIFLAYITISSLWIILFLRGFTTYVIAYSYYKCYIDDKPRLPFDIFIQLARGIKTLVIYNIGSIIFGSFIVLPLLVLNFILWVSMKVSGLKRKQSEHLTTRWLRRALCYVQRFVSHVYHMSTIELVVYKKNFLKSVSEVLCVHIRYPILTIIISMFNRFYVIFGSVITSVLTALFVHFHIGWVKLTLRYHITTITVLGVGFVIISAAVMKILTIGIVTYQLYDHHVNSSALNEMEENIAK